MTKFKLKKIKQRLLSLALAGALAIGLSTSPAAYAATDTDTDIEETFTMYGDNNSSSIACNYNLTGNPANYTNVTTPYQKHGKLSVSGTNIVDASGQAVQLRGVSLHGIQHTNGRTTAFKDYVNYSGFQLLRDEWGVNLIRIPVYTEEGGYCNGNSASMDTTIQNAVNYASQLGMYIIIDWHILSDGNPWNHQSEARTFFDKYSKLYAGKGNVIYEICNEPNGADWGTVKSYATSIIPVIRANDANALIVVGTPTWSQDVDVVSQNPIRNYDIGGSDSNLARNVLYTIHFYSAEYWHKDNLRSKVTTAHNNGLPMFCTEFGITQASGDGTIDIDSANTWMNLLKQYNISYAIWSFSNNNQTSSIFKTSCTKVNGWTNSDLATAGCWFVNTTRPLYDAEMSNSSSASASYPTVYNGVDYSAVYDYNYYISTNGDVKVAFGSNSYAALEHFVNYGMSEGRLAKASFNVHYYRNRYGDLRAAYGNDLKSYYMHYINYGAAERRDAKTYCATPAGVSYSSSSSSSSSSQASSSTTVLNGVDYSPVYNFNYYVNRYGDLKAAFGNNPEAALTHFVIWGMREGRQASANFDVYSYARGNQDLRLAYGNDLRSYYEHYIKYGRYEGRRTTGITTLQNPVTVLGGIDYSPVYDYNYYISANPDVRSAFGIIDDTAVLEHFIKYGMSEGRRANATFNVYTYKNNYKDLQAAFGNNLKAYYMHYLKDGIKEKRKASN